MKNRPYHGTHWTPAQQSSLRGYANANTPTRVIALKLGRTTAAVERKASELHISLKPDNQSPYNRRT